MLNNKLSVNQIEKSLGFNKIEPIVLTKSDRLDATEKDDYFEAWYEEELKAFYEKN